MEPRVGRRGERSDARRNRETLLAEARAMIAASGSAELRLDELARRAGVGPGTLYRHFANRTVLLEALYRDELERVAEAARGLAATETPLAALRAWLLLFLEYLATKRLVVPVLGGVSPSGGATPISDSVRLLAARAVAADEMRADLDPVDLLRALAGLATLDPAREWLPAARRMVDVLLAGARPEV